MVSYGVKKIRAWCWGSERNDVGSLWHVSSPRGAWLNPQGGIKLTPVLRAFHPGNPQIRCSGLPRIWLISRDMLGNPKVFCLLHALLHVFVSYHFKLLVVIITLNEIMWCWQWTKACYLDNGGGAKACYILLKSELSCASEFANRKWQGYL